MIYHFCELPRNYLKKGQVALDSRKPNEISVKRKTQMPNMEEPIPRIFKKIAEGPPDEI